MNDKMNDNNIKGELNEMAFKLTIAEVCLRFSGAVLPLNWVDPIARYTIETYLQFTKDSEPVADRRLKENRDGTKEGR